MQARNKACKYGMHKVLGRVICLLPVLVVMFFIESCGGDFTGRPGGGWEQLFDGRSLAGWEIIGDANWHVDDSVIVASQGYGRSFLLARQVYGNFLLKVEFMPGKDTNSGIYIRCGDRHELTPDTCYEINIFDNHNNKDYRTGSIIKLDAPDWVAKTRNQWNTFLIEATSKDLTVELNGKVISHISNPNLERGYVALQYGKGDIRFRKIEIKNID